MKTGELLLLGGLALAAYEYEQLNTAVGTVQFQLAAVQPNGIANYNIQLLVQNVSNISCSLNALTGTVSVNGNPIGNLSDFNPVTIAGRSQQIVNIVLTPNLIELPFAVQQLLNNSSGALDFTIEGNANVNGIILPFTLDKTVVLAA